MPMRHKSRLGLLEAVIYNFDITTFFRRCPEDRRLMGDDWFESIFLRQRVCLSQEFRALCWKWPGFRQECAVDGTGERDLVVAYGLFAALFL
jgi:hypothetical protein